MDYREAQMIHEPEHRISMIQKINRERFSFLMFSLECLTKIGESKEDRLKRYRKWEGVV